jgi:hypothetical protein
MSKTLTLDRLNIFEENCEMMAKEQIRALAKANAARRTQPEALWLIALETLSGLVDHAHLSRSQMETLAGTANSPRHLIILLEYARKSSSTPSTLSDLIEQSDASPYSLADWLEALEVFHDKLSSDGRSTTLPMAWGFISCSTEANPHTASLQSLASIVDQMFDEFGFEG